MPTLWPISNDSQKMSPAERTGISNKARADHPLVLFLLVINGRWSTDSPHLPAWTSIYPFTTQKRWHKNCKRSQNPGTFLQPLENFHMPWIIFAASAKIIQASKYL